MLDGTDHDDFAEAIALPYTKRRTSTMENEAREFLCEECDLILSPVETPEECPQCGGPLVELPTGD